jgi:DNA-binding NarL/FixJ family response regulator
MAFKKQLSERTITVSLSDELIAELQRIRDRSRAGERSATMEELVHEAVAGYVAGHPGHAVDRSAPRHPASPQHKLSRRQRQVLEMIARGRTTKEIAQHLGISVKTADWHRGQLMKTLDLHGVVEVVRYAIRAGIIQP